MSLESLLPTGTQCFSHQQDLWNRQLSLGHVKIWETIAWWRPQVRSDPTPATFPYMSGCQTCGNHILCYTPIVNDIRTLHMSTYMPNTRSDDLNTTWVLGHLRTMCCSNVTVVCVAALMTFSRILIVILRFRLLNYLAIIFLHWIFAWWICPILLF